MRDLSPEIEAIATQVVDAAYQLHRALGPGLLESAYEIALLHELTKRGLKVQRQVPVNVQYDGVALGTGFRIDLLIENTVVVELKAVDEMHPVYQAQLITYLKLARKPVGFLINFNVVVFKDAIKRYVN